MRTSSEQQHEQPEMVEMRQRGVTVSVSNDQENKDGNDEGVGMARRPVRRSNNSARHLSMASKHSTTVADPSNKPANTGRYLDSAHAREVPDIYDYADSILPLERPPSVHSIPLQRARSSHGRDSILEMDLADAAMEPASAAEMADPGLQERERRRIRKYNKRMRRTPSIASRQTKRTVRTRAGEALKAIKARTRRDSSSSSSSSDDSSSSSGSSSSTGINWRFWRPSSASTVSDDSYIPPEPTFTLFTPRLANSLHSAVPSEQDLADLSRKKSIPHPYTKLIRTSSNPAFHSFLSAS